MLSIICNWLYVIITTYLVGFATLQWIVSIPHMYTAKGNKKCVYKLKRPESPLVAGIIVVTIYAQLFSLVSGVGLTANIMLAVVSIFIMFWYRYELLEIFIDLIRRNRGTAELFLSLAVFLLFAYGTSHGLMHYDTDLYHAQSIRWIEEYGAVRGLGNLHLRLGYNSAAFALSALYSMSFLGTSMHAMAGYFALLLGWQCVGLWGIARRKHPILSDFVRLIAAYYLFGVYDELVSPASDYFMTTMVLYIVIVWLDLYAEHERSFLPHALLCMVAVYATTIKLSAAPMVLLSAYPIHRLISKRHKQAVKPILYFCIFGVMIVFPFLARNVILTGWLVYPFTALNLFNVEWKIPIEKAISDSHEIMAYGRGFTDITGYYASLREWVPLWIGKLSTFNKLMLILNLVAFPVFALNSIFYAAVKLYGNKKGEVKDNTKAKVFHMSHRKTVNFGDFLFIETVAFISLLYWFFTSPLIRYGCIYLWLPPVMLIGRYAVILYNRFELAKNEKFLKVVMILLFLFMAYKSAVLVVDDIPRFRGIYLVNQQEYNSYDLIEKKIGKISFYYPKEGDRTGYNPFPSAPTIEGFELMGNDLSAGFKPSGG